MSKIFFDHLIILEDVETEIKSIAESSEEKEELWKLVDDIVQHRIIISILDQLPIEYHEEFLNRFHESPHHEKHLHYLNDKIEGEIVDVITGEIKLLEKELLREIKTLKSKK